MSTVCFVPRCPELAASGSGYCDSHRPASSTHDRSRQERGYDRSHDVARAQLATTLPASCAYGCGKTLRHDSKWVAAHVVDGDPTKGWVAACPSCNLRARSARLQPEPTAQIIYVSGAARGRQYRRSSPSFIHAPTSARVIHIVGQPGSGKSTLGRALAADLGLQRIDMADLWADGADPRYRWRNLAGRIVGTCIVETTGASPWEEGFWRCETATVRCDVPTEVRRARLRARPEAGEERGYVERMLAVGIPRVSSDHEWNGETPIGAMEYVALLHSLKVKTRDNVPLFA